MIEISADDPPIRLNPRLDADLIARVFRAAGRVYIPDFLDPACAGRIHRCLVAETPWQFVLFDGEEHRELGVASLDDLPDADRQALLERIGRAGQRGFSYR